MKVVILESSFISPLSWFFRKKINILSVLFVLSTERIWRRLNENIDENLSNKQIWYYQLTNQNILMK